ncbi:MAG: tetratricopeptide repeat protein [Promethearchaeota archaeon]
MTFIDTSINFPPKEISNPIFGKPDFELIILWMLNNNDSCSWAEFKKIVKPSTLSLYLKELKEENYVERSDYNEYRITSSGKDRFYELSQSKSKKRKVNYPPRQMLHSGRNYEDWILWMAYNNNYLTWSDFLKKPLSINQSSLSKALNNLMDEEHEHIRKDEKHIYHITQLGKSKYSKILKKYELDRQSILDSESNRIKDMTEKTIKFFESYNIKDNELRFRFLSYLLKLPYAKVKNLLTEETDFYKILLYLSYNHPSQFPNYISREEFALKYGVEIASLDFFILQIVEKSLYSIKFFKIEDTDGSCYFLIEGDKLEKMLRAVVEEQVTKFTYLNKLYEKELRDKFSENLDLIIFSILDDVSVKIFDEGMRKMIETLLPSYIRYLAFKFERKRIFKGSNDKLKGLIWREVKAFAIIEPEMKEGISIEEKVKQIDKTIKKNPNNLDLYQSKETIFIYFNRYDALLNLYDEIIDRFPNKKKEVKIKTAYILKEKRLIEEGLEIIEDLINEYPNDLDLISYKAYWLQYLNQKDEAISTILSIIDMAPNKATYRDTYGEILMAFEEYEKAINSFQKALELGIDDWYEFQTFIKIGICRRQIGNLDIAMEYLIRGTKAIEKSEVDTETKQKWFAIAEPFIKELKELQH